VAGVPPQTVVDTGCAPIEATTHPFVTVLVIVDVLFALFGSVSDVKISAVFTIETPLAVLDETNIV
jgi:hypothetical protein